MKNSSVKLSTFEKYFSLLKEKFVHDVNLPVWSIETFANISFLVNFIYELQKLSINIDFQEELDE